MTNRDRLKLFSENLNILIKRSGKQQKEVAFDLDIPVTTLNNWCPGKAIPRYNMLERLSAYFNCPVTHIMDSKVDDPKQKLILIIDDMSNEQKERLLAYARFLKTPEADT